VVERAARHWGIPLGMPLMDLEHAADGQSAEYHALLGAVRYIARHTDLTPCAMLIGPFSLATRLTPDPITGVALAGRGVSAEEEPLVREIENALGEAERRVLQSLAATLAAGARVIIICEPAASIAYFSPRQLRAGSNVFQKYVMQPNVRLKRTLEEAGAGLIFHDCGELTPEMVRAFGHEIHPVMLSLGSSRKLWEDAALVPGDVVLYGNLPTKTFYCDGAAPDEAIRQMTVELLQNMRQCGHPFILGSECDVLDVPGRGETIRRKLGLMLACGEPHQ
jgi:uroporphyrinogen-III decarboxylase